MLKFNSLNLTILLLHWRELKIYELVLKNCAKRFRIILFSNLLFMFVFFVFFCFFFSTQLFNIILIFQDTIISLVSFYCTKFFQLYERVYILYRNIVFQKFKFILCPLIITLWFAQNKYLISWKNYENKVKG